MRYEIVLAPEAVADLFELKANVRVTVRRTIEQNLRHQPQRTSKSRIKRLRGLTRPQYRLRAGDVRVFYDVIGNQVQILGIVDKKNVEQWLAQTGEPDEDRGAERS